MRGPSRPHNHKEGGSELAAKEYRYARTLIAAVVAIAVLAAGAVQTTGAATAVAAGPAKAKATAPPSLRLKTRTRITSLLVPYFGLEHIAAAPGCSTSTT